MSQNRTERSRKGVEFSGDIGGGLRKNRMAGACLVFDFQSFSFGCRDAAGQSGGGNEMAVGDIHVAVHGGEERREVDEAWARRLLTEDIKREGWTAKDLAQGRPEQGSDGAASAGGNDNDAGLDRQRVEYGRGGFAGEPFAKKEMTKICDYAGPTPLGRPLYATPLWTAVTPLRGIERTLLQTEGALNWQNGIYQYILDPSGQATYQRFIPGCTITGSPNQ